MTHNLTYLKDAIGNNYVGINIPNEDFFFTKMFLIKILYIISPNKCKFIIFYNLLYDG